MGLGGREARPGPTRGSLPGHPFATPLGLHLPRNGGRAEGGAGRCPGGGGWSPSGRGAAAAAVVPISVGDRAVKIGRPLKTSETRDQRLVLETWGLGRERVSLRPRGAHTVFAPWPGLRTTFLGVSPGFVTFLDPCSPDCSPQGLSPSIWM